MQGDHLFLRLTCCHPRSNTSCSGTVDAHLQFSDESQQKMLEYVHFIEGRLSELPSEIEVGLDPQQIAKILGESLRQHFVQSGVTDTVAGLQATTAAMGNVQKQLSGVLRDVTDRDSGIAAKVESANRHVVQSLERRTKALDELLHEFKTDLLRIWIPLATAATLLIGLFAGVEIQGCRDSEPAPVNQSISTIAPAAPTSLEEPTVNTSGQRREKRSSKREEHVGK